MTDMSLVKEVNNNKSCEAESNAFKMHHFITKKQVIKQMA